MTFKRSLLFVGLTALLSGATMISAQDQEVKDYSSPETPWLEGVKIGPKPTELSPVLPLKIYLDNGEAIPATLTEDIPITVVADTTIFDPDPPAEYNGKAIQSPQWARKAAISWFFIDWEKNQNTPARSSGELAVNQMVITPLNPTGKAAITCHIGRQMRYYAEDAGKTKATFVNASVAKDVRVTDITPPTCGLEVTVENGNSGLVQVVENPPNHYPLPKMADVLFSGALANPAAPDEPITLQGIELGAGMVVPAEKAALTVPANAVLKVRVVGQDNYLLNNEKLKYGLSGAAGGEPAAISDINAEAIDLSRIKLPETPYLFVDAQDMAGNRQILYVPLKIK